MDLEPENLDINSIYYIQVIIEVLVPNISLLLRYISIK